MLMMTQTGGTMSGGRPAISYTQSSNITTGGNIYTLMGSPSGAADYTFIINAGVTVSSNSTATPALQTGSFPAGSTLTIVNNGDIRGMGGAGGDASSNGSAGGNALSIALSVTIDNGSGNIWGGGGGGGGGGGSTYFCDASGGGGGGGGASGSTNSSGGNGGGGSGNGSGGSPGSAGTSSGAGSGGAGGAGWSCFLPAGGDGGSG